VLAFPNNIKHAVAAHDLHIDVDHTGGRNRYSRILAVLAPQGKYWKVEAIVPSAAFSSFTSTR
jgi:hypothetical protein